MNVLGVLVILSWTLPSALAQDVPPAPGGDSIPAPQDRVGRHSVGMATIGLLPVGRSGEYIEPGMGLGLSGIVGLDRRGVLGLRVDGSVQVHGFGKIEVPVGPGGESGQIDINTTALTTSFGVGPQLTLDFGSIRPYVLGTLAVSYFAGTLEVAGTPLAVSFDDWTPTLDAGGGVRVQVDPGSDDLGYLDLGVRYSRRGVATKPPEGQVDAISVWFGFTIELR